MGFHYSFTAIPASNLSAVLAPSEDFPDGWDPETYEQNNGHLLFHGRFGLLVEMLEMEQRPGWVDLRIAICGSRDRDAPTGQGYLDPSEVKIAADVFARIPRAKLERAVWGEVLGFYGTSDPHSKLLGEAAEVYHQLMEMLAQFASLYASAAAAGDVVLVDRG